MNNKKILVCNKCGARIELQNEVAKQDYLLVNKPWGYFSKKDGKTYKFVICEECVDKIIEEFVVPVEVQDTIELL